MKMTRVLFATLTLSGLAACPGPQGNPATLWLAPNGSEVVIKLVDHEPPPW